MRGCLRAPEDFGGFLEALDAEAAKAISIVAACGAAAAPELDPKVRDAWATVLTQALSGPPYLFGLDYVGSYGDCTDLVQPEALFEGEWAQLRTGIAGGEIADTRLSFLSKLRLPAGEALSTWGEAAKRAGSLRARRIAVNHLRSYVRELDDAALPAWRAFFIDITNSTDVAEVLGAGLRGLQSTAAPTAEENADALAALSRLLRQRATRSVHASAVCAARALTGEDSEAFARFAKGVEDAPLSLDAAALLRDPTDCG